MKVVLEVPRLRDMLPKINQQGMDFNNFTKNLGNIYRNTVSNLYDKTGIDDHDGETDQFGISKGKKKLLLKK